MPDSTDHVDQYAINIKKPYAQNLSITDGAMVRIEDMLAARDDRVARQQAMIEKHRNALISLTLVLPGPYKASSMALYVFNEALKAFNTALAQSPWSILMQEIIHAPTGHEALLSINAPAPELKAWVLHLEKEHPLGRLWDFDVIQKNMQSVSRKALGFEARRCLICNDIAHRCSRSRAHSIEDLLSQIELMVKNYV